MLVEELRKLATDLQDLITLKYALADIGQIEEQVDLEEQLQTFLDKYSKGILADIAKGPRASIMQTLKKTFPDWSSDEFKSARNLIGPEGFDERAARLSQDIIWFALEKLSRS